MIVPFVHPPVCVRWPDAYVGFDEGRMLVHPNWVERFRSLGWTTVTSVMESASPRVFRRAGERENATIDFCDDGRVCYLKRHFSRDFGRWLKEWYQTRHIAPAGWLEACAAQECERAGVATPVVVAAGWHWKGRPWRTDSFFLSEAVPESEPVDQFCVRRRHWTVESRRRLIRLLAETTRKLHRAGLCHRDYYWSHLFVREQALDQFELTLIDLQRVFRPLRIAGRWRLKDLAQFVFSAPPGWLDGADLEHWFSAYLGKRRMTSLDRQWLRAIRARAAIYRWRESAA